jgi:hypothetical protein
VPHTPDFLLSSLILETSCAFPLRKAHTLSYPVPLQEIRASRLYFARCGIPLVLRLNSTGWNLLALELVPQVLVIHIVMELNLGNLDQAAEQPRAPVRRGLFEVGITSLYVLSQQGRGPF